MDWKVEADHVADLVFKTQIGSRFTLDSLWAFGRGHSLLFGPIEGVYFTPDRKMCLTQIRDMAPRDGFKGLDIPFGDKDLIKAIQVDERIPCTTGSFDLSSKEAFRKQLDAFVDWRNKLDPVRETSDQTG